jgi:hypothetical protein
MAFPSSICPTPPPSTGGVLSASSPFAQGKARREKHEQCRPDKDDSVLQSFVSRSRSRIRAAKAAEDPPRHGEYADESEPCCQHPPQDHQEHAEMYIPTACPRHYNSQLVLQSGDALFNSGARTLPKEDFDTHSNTAHDGPRIDRETRHETGDMH